MNIVSLPQPKFSKGDMRSLLVHQAEAVVNAVREIGPDEVLTTPVEDLADRIYEKLRIEPIVLHHDRRISSGAKDRALTIDSWTGGQVTVDGTRVEVLVPYEGDTVLFDVRASTFNYNPPRFDLRNGAVVAAFEGRAPLDKEQAKAAIEGLLHDIELHLTWQRTDIDPWNERMKRDLPGEIQDRRVKVLQDRELDAFLDVPVIGRANSSPSFAVDPPKRPRPAIDQPDPATPGFAPEPAISMDGFAAILAEIESVTIAVQRLPNTFATMPEESLRDVLLVVLNNRFGPASGETFSRAGKTDIFIPWGGDQRAVFIAECKWWKGPAAFRKAIDQLLGYTAWRDSNAALILFVREGSPSDISEKASEELRAHQLFKRMTTVAGRSVFTLANRDDDRREIHVALLVIPVLS
jgi:hypothetical protein